MSKQMLWKTTYLACSLANKKNANFDVAVLNKNIIFIYIFLTTIILHTIFILYVKNIYIEIYVHSTQPAF